MLWRNLAHDVQHDLRLEAYAHVQELELRYFEDRQSGGLLAVLNDDVNQLERFLDIGALPRHRGASSTSGRFLDIGAH